MSAYNKKTDSMPKVEVTLVCDNRERSLFDYLPENDTVVRAQMTTADYAFITNDSILEIFERKSLGDYADSFKDGRHENKNKLLSMREITGCNIYYVVEGVAPEDHSEKIHGISYSAIEASMFNMMSNCGIFVIRTTSPEDTARMLLAKRKALVNSINSNKFELKNIVESPIEKLCERVPLTINQIVRSMFEEVPGISKTTAEVLAQEVPLKSLFFGGKDGVSINDKLKNIKVNGRKLSSSKIKKITTFDPEVFGRMFKAVPGIKDTTVIEDALNDCNDYNSFIEKISTVYKKSKVKKIITVLSHEYEK